MPLQASSHQKRATLSWPTQKVIWPKGIVVQRLVREGGLGICRPAPHSCEERVRISWRVAQLGCMDRLGPETSECKPKGRRKRLAMQAKSPSSKMPPNFLFAPCCTRACHQYVDHETCRRKGTVSRKDYYVAFASVKTYTLPLLCGRSDGAPTRTL